MHCSNHKNLLSSTRVGILQPFLCNGLHICCRPCSHGSGGGQKGREACGGESGWPNRGRHLAATVENAWIYNNNLKNHIRNARSTPKRVTYLDFFFNENQKPNGVEQHFGFFYPDFREIYSSWHWVWVFEFHLQCILWYLKIII